jgi:hypothetical protein
MMGGSLNFDKLMVEAFYFGEKVIAFAYRGEIE